MNIVQVFQRAVARHGSRRFLFDTTNAISYAEADARSNAIACELLERAVLSADTVALCSRDRVSLWLSIIGTWKIGALPALIDPRSSDDQISYFLKDAAPKLIIAGPETRERIQRICFSNILDIDQLGLNSSSIVPNRHGPGSPLYLSYTSGTTGLPKGVVLLSEPVTLGTSCIADRLQLTHSDTLLATTPISSSFQLVAALMPALFAGACVGLAAGATTDTIWEMALTHKTTVLVAYPLTLSDVVNTSQTNKVDSPFRVALSGGSSLAPRIKRSYLDQLGIRLLESYGQSELGGFMAMGSLLDPDEILTKGFAGRPLPDRLAFVGNADCAELPAGQVGEVMVTHGFFDHYRNKLDKTVEATRGAVLHTGDLGVSNEYGYLKFLGRLGESGKARERGGYLREAEDALYENHCVQHAVVVESRDGEIRGFVELLPNRHADPKELLEFLSTQISQKLLPQQIEILDKMPRSFSGKADRLKLSARHG